MKKLIITTLIMSMAIFQAYAGLSKTIHLSTPGTLGTSLTATEVDSVTSLTITGLIDARDFKILRDSMALLDSLNIENVDIMAYSGAGGTCIGIDLWTYFDNSLPLSAFSTYKKKLKSVILPHKLKVISEDAFQKCISLKHIVIPTSVDSIKDGSFRFCDSLESVSLGDSLKYLGAYAFNTCFSLKSIVLPNSLDSINANPFYRCSSLVVGVLPTSPTYIYTGEAVYRNVDKLTTVVIPSNIIEISQYFLRESDAIETFIVPSTVKTLRNGILKDCSKLKTAYIPSSVSTINGSIFYNDSSLTSLKVMHVIPPALGTTVFYNVKPAKCTLYVQTGSKAAYQAASQWSAFTNIVELDSVVSKSVTLNGGDLYAALTDAEKISTTKLVISGTVNAHDFKFMRDEIPFLEDVDLSAATIVADNTVDSTFLRSASVAPSAFPSNTIPFRAFFGKAGLRVITMPSSLTAIGDSAFWGCTQLRIIGLTNANPIDISAATNAFQYVSRSTCKLTVPDGAIANYRSASVWSEFLSIEANVGTNVIAPNSSSSITVSTLNGQSIASGLVVGTSYSIYNMQGQLITSSIATADTETLSLPSTGSYVLVAVGEIVKFIK